MLTEEQKNQAMFALSDGQRTETDREQVEVLLQAFDIFLERNRQRADLWKDGGAVDSLHHMRSKLARIRSIFERILTAQGTGFTPRQLAEIEDDALDLINYTVFFVRNARADNLLADESQI